MPRKLPFIDQLGRSADLIAGFDWTSTSLGDPIHWSGTLKAAVGLVLGSDQACNLMWGPDLITFYNDAYRPLLGSCIPDGIGVPFPVFRPDVWPAVKQQIIAGFAGQASTVENIQVLSRRDGNAREAYFTVSCTPIQENSSVVGVLSHILETTKTVRAQHELEGENGLLKRGLNLLPQMVWSTLADGYPDFYNDRWYDFTGKARGWADGESWIDVFHPDDREGAWACWRNSLRTGKPYETKYRLKHRDASYRWVLARALPEHDEAGNVIRWYGTCTDIHDHVLAQEKVKSLQSDLVHVSRISAMGIMAATLAHEVNQPLMAAANFAAGLRLKLDVDDSPGTLIGLAGLEKALLRAGDIIRRFKAMAPVKSPQVQEHVHVAGLVNEARELLRDECSHVPVLIDSEEEAMVVCDPHQIHQVLTNLIRNACQAMHGDEQPRISIITRSEGRRLRFSVEDNGPGINRGEEEEIFGGCRTSDKGGMGIGLAICRTIVEAHGGQIGAENLNPRGARFTFDLPAVCGVD